MAYFSAQLKIKRVSLAVEAREIRREEIRARGAREDDKRASLYHHRIDIVRPAARHAHLAHAFLMGRPYASVEREGSRRPDIERLVKEIRKFGLPEAAETKPLTIERWIEGEPVATEAAA